MSVDLSPEGIYRLLMKQERGGAWSRRFGLSVQVYESVHRRWGYRWASVRGCVSLEPKVTRSDRGKVGVGTRHPCDPCGGCPTVTTPLHARPSRTQNSLPSGRTPRHTRRDRRSDLPPRRAIILCIFCQETDSKPRCMLLANWSKPIQKSHGSAVSLGRSSEHAKSSSKASWIRF